MIMAEYKLSYTASDIDAKLGKIDGTKTYYNSTEVDEKLANKQDNLAFDTEPTEGSENMVKSGAVYTAMQNATPNLTYDEAPTEGSENLVNSGTIYTALQNINVGGSYTAGDLIEIKDGIIRSTLGDGSVGTQSAQIFETDYIANGDNASMPPFYLWQKDDSYSPFVLDDKVYLYCTDSSGVEKFIGEGVMEQDAAIDTVFGEGSQIGCRFNISSSWSDTFGLTTGTPSITPIDSSITVNEDIACFVFLQNLQYSNIVVIGATQDYPNVKFRVCKDISVTNYIKLPNEALTFDNEPIENSTNLVNSGDLYNVIGDINTVITQINTLIGGAS